MHLDILRIRDMGAEKLPIGYAQGYKPLIFNINPNPVLSDRYR